MATQITNLFLYRWRYVLGFSLISLAALGLLLIAVVFIPGGISKAEIHSVAASESLSFTSFAPSAVIDAPYHALQWLSIRVFGLNDISIKLPSALIAILTVVGVVGLLRYWFRRNVAVLTTIVVLTTGQFLFFAQSGTPRIMPIFWAVWILLSALMMSRQAHFSTLWKVIFFATAALSLYTPLSIYMLLAVVSAGILHPHLRFIVRRMAPTRVSLAILFAVGIVTPLAYAISVDRHILYHLIGWPGLPITWQQNLSELVTRYVDFTSVSHGIDLTPIYGLGVIMLVILGIVRFATTKYTARGYILTAWIVLLLPVIVLNPREVGVTFVPITLLVAMGIDLLFQRWYSLFPRNPYARVAGLVPLAILMGGMIASGVTRYVNDYTYDPIKANQFSQDLTLANRQIAMLNGDQTISIVITKSSAPLYRVLEKYNPAVHVSTHLPSSLPSSGPLLVARGVQMSPSTDHLAQIITNNKTLYADRFYLYRK